jgi:SAM-dependent methyltransferase
MRHLVSRLYNARRMAEPKASAAQTAGDAPRYRVWVGPPHKYDLIAAMQFNLLTTLGLREHHFLLDVGCGSLRGGRLFIPYLLPDHYFGIEPEAWLIEEGIEKELGRDAVRIKQPTFSHIDDFRLSSLGQEFDFVLAQSIFTHAAERQIRTCLTEAKKVLAPDGTMAATYFPGPQNHVGDDWVYPGGTAYQPEFMVSLAAEAGLDLAPLAWPHPNKNQRWLLICHEGAAERAAGVTAPAAV